MASGTGKRGVSRRTVYLATVIAMVGLSAGFVLAASVGGLTASTSGQNYGSVSAPGNSQFAGSVSVNLAQTTAPASSCDQAATWTPGSPYAGVFVYGDGTAACQTSTAGWWENVTFVASSAAGSDTFFITTSGGAQANSISFTEAVTATSGILSVYLYVGPASGAPTAFTSITIAVSGR